MNNSKCTFYFIADTESEYDANGSINSNGEINGICTSSNNDLTINTAASKVF